MENILFCDFCGAFRDLSSSDGRNISCNQCDAEVPVKELSDRIAGTKHRAPIERSDLLLRLYGRSREDAGAADETIIDEECPKCKHPQLSFHTAQLRGVDEGQTIFYTCVNKTCGHKFTVNS